jgi:DNA polymerase type B, organellar and viral
VTDQYRLERTLSGKPIKERKGDRHKPRQRPPHSGGKTKTKWERRIIVAWDGEGANLTDGTHVYNLLANSNGDYILNHEGLSTQGVIDFFFHHSNPRDINVIYGGSYDVNMILRDVPQDILRKLWDNGSCFWENYQIIYAPRKKLTITRFYHMGKKLKRDSFILWDVLGYFQSSFVVACRKWLGDLPILDDIENMKHQRSGFDVAQIKSIIQYNQHECNLLVRLVESLFDAMDEGEIKLSRYDGAGSIAGALLRKYNIQSHRGEPTEDALRWSQYAYSGGWIEAMKIGTTPVPTPIYRYDINSAYPSAAMMLPSYAGASWEMEATWNGLSSSLVHIRWHFDEAPFYPLFYREPDGSIIHPQWGEGIYFGSEVALLEKFHAAQYEVIESLNVRLNNQDKPFQFIDEVYALRMLYKSIGSMASEALKLGMNSIYGKLAQQAGYRNGRIPQYHHLLWAGEITSRTRANLYSAAMQHPHSVIAFATDAIIATDSFTLSEGKALGQWTPEIFSGITIIQPGVYFLQDQDDWYDKYRGFDKGALMREDIIEAWKSGTDYYANLTRFVTMGSALQSTDFYGHWRKWETQKRKLDIVPGGKRMPGRDTCYWEGLCDTLPVLNMHTDTISNPYPIEWVVGDKPLRPTEDGVDIRILEQEYLDAYA